MSWSGLRQPAIHWRSPSGGRRAGRKAWRSRMREDSFGGHSIVPPAFTVAAAQAAAVTTEALWKHPSLFKIANGAVIEIVSSSIAWSLRGQGQIYRGRKYSTRLLQRLMGKAPFVFLIKNDHSPWNRRVPRHSNCSLPVLSRYCAERLRKSSFCFFNLVSTSCSPSSAQKPHQLREIRGSVGLDLQQLPFQRGRPTVLHVQQSAAHQHLWKHSECKAAAC